MMLSVCSLGIAGCAEVPPDLWGGGFVDPPSVSAPPELPELPESSTCDDSAEPPARESDPTCEYSFELDSCTGTWRCDDGRVIELTMAQDVEHDFGTCITEYECSQTGGQFGDMGLASCGLAPAAERIPCAVGTEEAALELCGPWAFALSPVPPGCGPQESPPQSMHQSMPVPIATSGS